MKKIICVTLLLTMVLPGYSMALRDGIGSGQVPGFSKSWVDEDVDFREFDVIYLDRVDTEKVTVDVSDLNLDDYGDAESEYQLKKDVAYEMRKRFYDALEEVIPVVIDKSAIAGRKALILRLKLAGHAADTGLIENMLPGVEGRAAVVSVNGVLIDASSGKEVLTVADTYSARISEKDVSLLGTSDMGVWHKAMDFWSDKLALFLFRKFTGTAQE